MNGKFWHLEADIFYVWEIYYHRSLWIVSLYHYLPPQLYLEPELSFPLNIEIAILPSGVKFIIAEEWIRCLPPPPTKRSVATSAIFGSHLGPLFFFFSTYRKLRWDELSKLFLLTWAHAHCEQCLGFFCFTRARSPRAWDRNHGLFCVPTLPVCSERLIYIIFLNEACARDVGYMTSQSRQ